MKKYANTIIVGVMIVLFFIGSTIYSVLYNQMRLIESTDLSTYVFQISDLPMLLSIVLLMIYVVYLALQLVKKILINKEKEQTSQYTRTIPTQLGFLGFAGCFGFIGFYTYQLNKVSYPFLFFLFFGFFSFFYEGKMSHTLMDERFIENKMKASQQADKISFTMIFISALVFGTGNQMISIDITGMGLMIMIGLSLGLNLFLRQYLLYHYDHDEGEV